MEPDADLRAPGGAITAALCGHWQHEPPCPLAPHHTAVDRTDGQVQLRTLFAADTGDEPTVRHCIETALSAGELVGPDGVTTRWRLRESRPSEVRADELDHAGRLINT